MSNLPESSQWQFTSDLRICRILNGMWQVSGGHGRIDPTTAVQNMFRYFDAGFTTWDLADHYGPAEDLIGTFRQQLIAKKGEAALSQLQAFTKWVPRPGKMTRQIVEQNIDISRRRMQTPTLDLLQFHWWEYHDSNYLDALKYMAELQSEGKIKHLALTNFDTEHLQIIVEQGIKIISNQVQFSLIDRRPLVQMVNFCQQHQIQLLAYGTVCGGLCSEAYLDKPEPGYFDLKTASLGKYKNMIDTWGGWSLFQELLKVLKKVAGKHRVTIPNVAVRYIRDQPMVAGAIVGVRLGIREHLADTLPVFNLQLDPKDYQMIDQVLNQSRNLFEIIGDCGDEYRRRFR